METMKEQSWKTFGTEQKKHEVGFPVELLTSETPIVLLLKLFQLLISIFFADKKLKNSNS